MSLQCGEEFSLDPAEFEGMTQNDETNNEKKDGDAAPANQDETANQSAPEVEAEIVDGDGPNDAAELTTETPDIEAETIDIETPDETAATTGASDAEQNTTLTPGVVMFLVFVIFAALLFGFWRIQTDRAPQSDTVAATSANELVGASSPRSAMPGSDDADAAVDEPDAEPQNTATDTEQNEPAAEAAAENATSDAVSDTADILAQSAANDGASDTEAPAQEEAGAPSLSEADETAEAAVNAEVADLSDADVASAGQDAIDDPDTTAEEALDAADLPVTLADAETSPADEAGETAEIFAASSETATDENAAGDDPAETDEPVVEPVAAGPDTESAVATLDEDSAVNDQTTADESETDVTAAASEAANASAEGDGNGVATVDERDEVATADINGADDDVMDFNAADNTEQSVAETQAADAAQAPADEAIPVAVAASPGVAPADDALEDDLLALREALQNETSSLNEAIAEERRRAESQAEELAAIRADIQALLARQESQSSAEIEELRSRLDQMQSAGSLPAASEVAAAVALSALQRAADRGGAFEPELNILARFAPDSAAVERLRDIAPEGAATRSALKESFAPAAVQALAADSRERASGVWSRFWSRVTSLVSVRPANPQAGEAPRAVISRAEDKLERDDIAGAVDELAALDGAVAAAIDDWLAEAKDRAAVEQSIAELSASLLSQLQD